MTEWVNSGAWYTADGSDIPTKAALKRLIAETPADATIYVIGEMGPLTSKGYTGDKLPVGYKFSVTGPNPFKSRKWYATVEKLASGKITVK